MNENKTYSREDIEDILLKHKPCTWFKVGDFNFEWSDCKVQIIDDILALQQKAIEEALRGFADYLEHRNYGDMSVELESCLKKLRSEKGGGI